MADGSNNHASPRAPTATTGPPFGFGEKFGEAIAASRFEFVKTETFYVFSFANFALSAAVAGGILALFVAHVILGYTVLQTVAHLSVVALIIAGIVTIHNQLQPSASLPRLSVPYDRAAISHLFALLGEGVINTAEYVNGLLQWRDVLASLRALAWAWLVARFSFLLNPFPLVTLGALAFVAAPAYLSFQRVVDQAFMEHALPFLQHAAIAVRREGDYIGLLLALRNPRCEHSHGVLIFARDAVTGSKSSYSHIHRLKYLAAFLVSASCRLLSRKQPRERSCMPTAL